MAAAFDITCWPPSLVAARYENESDEQHVLKLERDMAAGAAHMCRDVLRFHFRDALGAETVPPHLPHWVSPAHILRGGLQTLGVRAGDADFGSPVDGPWPMAAYLLDDLDTGKQALVVLRPRADAELVRGSVWDTARRFWASERRMSKVSGLVCLDAWPASGAVFWEPLEPIGPPQLPSWVWEQLPQSMSEYRQRLCERMWEWWIGALPPENDDAR